MDFFRSDTINQSIIMIKKIFLEMEMPAGQLQGIGYIFWLLIFDFINRNNERDLFKFHKIFKVVIFFS